MIELAATLLHEMAHLYDLEHDIQDVGNNGHRRDPQPAHIESTRNTARR